MDIWEIGSMSMNEQLKAREAGLSAKLRAREVSHWHELNRQKWPVRNGLFGSDLGSSQVSQETTENLGQSAADEAVDHIMNSP